MTTIAKFYSDLTNALATIFTESNIFLGERPSTVDSSSPMTHFVVAEIPVQISDVACGKHHLMMHTSGIFYVFTRAKKNNTLNVIATSDLVEQVVDLFPISGTYSVAANPTILGEGADGFGYHITSIAFNLHSK